MAHKGTDSTHIGAVSEPRELLQFTMVAPAGLALIRGRHALMTASRPKKLLLKMKLSSSLVSSLGRCVCPGLSPGGTGLAALLTWRHTTKALVALSHVDCH